jgi:hypothetical protein
MKVATHAHDKKSIQHIPPPLEAHTFQLATQHKETSHKEMPSNHNITELIQLKTSKEAVHCMTLLL